MDEHQKRGIERGRKKIKGGYKKEVNVEDNDDNKIQKEREREREFVCE